MAVSTKRVLRIRKNVACDVKYFEDDKINIVFYLDSIEISLSQKM